MACGGGADAADDAEPPPYPDPPLEIATSWIDVCSVSSMSRVFVSKVGFSARKSIIQVIDLTCIFLATNISAVAHTGWQKHGGRFVFQTILNRMEYFSIFGRNRCPVVDFGKKIDWTVLARNRKYRPPLRNAL